MSAPSGGVGLRLDPRVKLCSTLMDVRSMMCVQEGECIIHSCKEHTWVSQSFSAFGISEQ